MDDDDDDDDASPRIPLAGGVWLRLMSALHLLHTLPSGGDPHDQSDAVFHRKIVRIRN